MERGKLSGMGKYGMGHVYQRGHIWWIAYSKAGMGQQRESSKSRRREDAVRLLKARLGEIVTGNFVRPERMTMRELFQLVVDDYTARDHRSLYYVKLRIDTHLAPAVGKIRATEFGSEDVERYLRRRRNGEHRPANATLNRELAIIKRAFRLAAERTPPLVGRVPHILTLKEDNVRTGFLDDERYRAILHELPDYLKVLFVVGYHTGVRKGELLIVRWAQVDLKGREIRLRHGETKNDEGRTLPIYGDMLPWLEMAYARHQSTCPQCPWVFQEGGQRIKSFRKAWASACTRAGMPGLLFHDLRRSAVRNMERAGIPRKTAMAIAGHKTEAIYWRYAMSNDRDIRDAGRKLERYFEEIRTTAAKTITKSITVPVAKSPRPS